MLIFKVQKHARKDTQCVCPCMLISILGKKTEMRERVKQIDAYFIFIFKIYILYIYLSICFYIYLSIYHLPIDIACVCVYQGLESKEDLLSFQRIQNIFLAPMLGDSKILQFSQLSQPQQASIYVQYIHRYLFLYA